MPGLDTDDAPVIKPTQDDIDRGIGADPGVQAGIDQAENFANDPTNATNKDKVSGADAAKGAATVAAGAATGGVAGAARAAASFASNNKKGLGIGGGIVGLILVMVIAFASLLPFKLESLMNNLMDREFSHVQYYVERRAEKIIIRYAISNSLASDKAIVATGNPLGDLYKTWRTQKFEKTLADKYGLEFTKSTESGKVVRVKLPTGSADVGSEAEMSKFLNLNHAESRAFVNKTIKAETHWYQVLKRHHLRKWMMNAYGIKSWKVFSQKQGAEAKTELDAELKASAMDTYKSSLATSLACLFGDQAACEKKKNPVDPKEVPVDGDTADDAAKLAAAAEEVATDTTAKDFSKTFIDLVLKKGIGKALPIIGWIDLGARMDKLVYDDGTVHVINDLRKAQYAGVAAEWLKIKDQIKAGDKISGDEVNVAMVKLENMEKGNGFQSVYGTNQSSGERIDPKSLFGQAWLHTMRDSYVAITGVTGYHLIMEAYLSSVGALFDKIMGFVGGALGWLTSWIPGITSVEQYVAQLVAPVFSWIFQPVVTGLETGAELVNQIAVGTFVLAYDFTQSLGGHDVTSGQVIEQNLAMARINSAEAAQTSIWDRVASLDNSSSLLSQTVANIPASPSAALTTTLSTGMATVRTSGLNAILSLFSIFGANRAHAALNETYGLGNVGFTEADLNQDIQYPVTDIAGPPDANGNPTGPDNVIDQYDCPTDGSMPLCLLDVTTIQALQSTSTTADDGGIGGTVDTTVPTPLPTGTQAPGCSVPAPGSVPGAIEPAQNYTRVSFRGVTVNQMTKTQILLAETYAKQMGLNVTFEISQGSYRPRTSYSGTTHMGGGAADIRVVPLGSTTNILTAVKALRMAGFAAWYRLASDGFSGDHIHAELIGDKDSSAGAKSQVAAYFLGLSGLTNTTLMHDQSVGRPYPDWAAKYCSGKY